MAKIKLNIYQLTVAVLIVYIKAIVAKMTGNATFTSQAAKTTTLNNAVTALETAQADYLGSVQVTQGKLAVVNAAVTAVQAAARDSATGAESVTRDAALLLGGGWELQADHTAPVGPMPQVQDVSATGGDMEGTVDLQWQPQKRGLQVYLGRYATSPNGPWTQFYAGQASKCTAEGLVSGTEYWFEFCAVGAAGPGPWSNPARMRAS